MLFDPKNSIVDWLFPRRCLACSIDIDADYLCLSCRSFCHRIKSNSTADHQAIFYFELTIKEVIKKAKYNKSSIHLYLIYQLFQEDLEQNIAKIKEFSPEAITFVPNHWFHRISRNVELPSFFAGILSQKLNVPVIPMLKKVSFKRQALQKSKIERQAQIKGAFLLKKNPSFSRILLVDDIVTTGATFNEIKRLFGKNRQIYCLALAKTP